MNLELARKVLEEYKNNDEERYGQGFFHIEEYLYRFQSDFFDPNPNKVDFHPEYRVILEEVSFEREDVFLVVRISSKSDPSDKIYIKYTASVNSWSGREWYGLEEVEPEEYVAIRWNRRNHNA